MTDQNVWHETISQFIYHETHNHWHIDDIEEFSIRAYEQNTPDVPGDVVDDASSKLDSVLPMFSNTMVMNLQLLREFTGIVR